MEDPQVFELPQELIWKMLYYLPPKDVVHFCVTHRGAAQIICHNNDFWFEKIMRDFGDMYEIKREDIPVENRIETYKAYWAKEKFYWLTDDIKRWREFSNIEVSYRTPPIPPTPPAIYPPPSSFGVERRRRNANIKLAKMRYRQHRSKYNQYQIYLRRYERDPTFIEKLEANAEPLRALITGLTSA